MVFTSSTPQQASTNHQLLKLTCCYWLIKPKINLRSDSHYLQSDGKISLSDKQQKSKQPDDLHRLQADRQCRVKGGQSSAAPSGRGCLSTRFSENIPPSVPRTTGKPSTAGKRWGYRFIGRIRPVQTYRQINIQAKFYNIQNRKMLMMNCFLKHGKCAS